MKTNFLVLRHTHTHEPNLTIEYISKTTEHVSFYVRENPQNYNFKCWSRTFIPYKKHTHTSVHAMAPKRFVLIHTHIEINELRFMDRRFVFHCGAQVWKLRWTIHACKMWSSTQLLLFIRIYTRLCVTFLFDKCRHVLVKPHHPTTTTTKKALVKNGNSIEKARWRAMQEAKKKATKRMTCEIHSEKKRTHRVTRERIFKIKKRLMYSIRYFRATRKSCRGKKDWARESHCWNNKNCNYKRRKQNGIWEKGSRAQSAGKKARTHAHTEPPHTRTHTHSPTSRHTPTHAHQIIHRQHSATSTHSIGTIICSLTHSFSF